MKQLYTLFRSKILFNIAFRSPNSNYFDFISRLRVAVWQETVTYGSVRGFG